MSDVFSINDKELACVKKPNEPLGAKSKEEFEQMIKAIAKSKRDIVWWAEHFFRIVSLNTGLSVIKLYEKQRQMLYHLVNHDRNIVLAARQTGKTTTYTVFVLWLSTLFSEKKIMICANKLQTSIEIMDRIRLAYEYLPRFIKPGCVTYNRSEIAFSNKSTIRAFATSSSASRGFSCQCCIIDEMGFIPKNVINEFFASVMPVVSSAKDSKVIVVSTPNGTSGLYYDLWRQANSKERLKNKEGWSPFRVDWWEVPGRTEEWKEKQIASIGIQRWNQEFGNEFISGNASKKLISDEQIEQYRMKLSDYAEAGIKPKKQKVVSQDQREMFEFDMWHEFKPERTYAASMDIAEGVGTDSSVLYIWDVTDLSDVLMCAAFSSNCTSLVEFAYVASKMLALYGNPPLAAERNGVSAGTIDSLKITYGYTNIIVDNKKGEAGIFSHVTVKERACQWCREMTSTQGFGFTIYDKVLIDEMSTFVKKDTKGQRAIYAAIEGKDSHDDHMMAFVWLTYILQNDNVEKNFIVCQTFTTEFGKIFPKVLQPVSMCTGDMWRSISNDPLYKEFLQYKEEGQLRAARLKAIEDEDDRKDVFKYGAQQTHDIYFNDDDGPMWNNDNRCSGSSWQQYAPTRPLVLNPNAQMPSFCII